MPKSNIKNINIQLIKSAQAGNTTKLKKLLKQGADINYKDSKNQTCLCLAVKSNKIKTAKVLLKNGADPNSGLINSFTPLQTAIKGNNLSLVKLLLSAGADPEQPNKERFTPLMVANSFATFPVRDLIMRQLYGKKLNKQLLAARRIILAVAEGSIIKTERILKRLKNPDLAYLHNITALMVAVNEDQEQIVKILLAAGADVNKKNTNGGTALIAAAGMGNLNIVKQLIARGALVNQSTDQGITPLAHAVIKQDLKIINYLLLHGANPNFHNLKLAPLRIALGLKNKKIVKMLYSFGAKP